MAPPIADPYPVPRVMTALVQKPSPNATIGMALNNVDSHAVVVKRIDPDSLVRGTILQEGFEILAINGEAIHNRKQASAILKAYSQLEFTVIDPIRSLHSPCTYVEVAPTSKISPGVSFDSCSNRTMVMISEIFLSDLSKTRLRVGDIVLAINGRPIWKPEQADEEQLKAARASQAVVLYCVDMDGLCDDISSNTKMTSHTQTKNAVPVKKWYTEIRKEAPSHYFIQSNMDGGFISCKFDHTSLMFVQEQRHVPGEINKKMCDPVFESMNHLLKEQLLVLKCKVAAEGWRHAVRNEDENDDDNAPPAYCVPSAPLAPIAMQGHDVALARTSDSCDRICKK